MVVHSEQGVSIEEYAVYPSLGFFTKWLWNRRGWSVKEPVFRVNKGRAISVDETFKNERVKELVKNGKSVNVYRDNDGVIHELFIRKEKNDKDGYAGELLDSDMMRNFSNQDAKTVALTRSKYDKLIKGAVIVLLVLFTVGLVVIGIVLVTKYNADALTSISSQIKANNVSIAQNPSVLGG
jgi:hypothetical protein